jgi:hypothetical protein
MPTKNNRLPKSFYFSSQYKAPFHRNEDRLNQIDFRTFDPFVPESRQTVANCKKHRRQRHELSDKCKHVLAVVDAQERLLSTRPEAQQAAGYSAQGSTMHKPDISIEFGDGIPEIAKEYVKFWIEQSGMVKEPYSRQYDVHNIKDQHNHAEKPSIVLMAPFMETDITDENQLTMAIRSFFENPKIFAAKGKVGNLRIYSINKKTHEEDAVGYLNHLPIKIIGKETITKNLQKAERVREDNEPPIINLEDRQENVEEGVDIYKDKIENIQYRIDNPMEGDAPEYVLRERLFQTKTRYYNLLDDYQEFASEPEKQRISTEKRKLKSDMDAVEQHKKASEYNNKQRKILMNMLSPENNIPPTRTNDPYIFSPAVQVAEAPFRIAANLIGGLVDRKMAQKEHDEETGFENRMKQIHMDEQTLRNTEYSPSTSGKKEEEDEPFQRIRTEEKEGKEKQAKTPPAQGQRKEEPAFEVDSSKMKQNPIGAGGLVSEAQRVNAKQKPAKPRHSGHPESPEFGQESINLSSRKYLNTSDLIIIAKLKRGGI